MQRMILNAKKKILNVSLFIWYVWTSSIDILINSSPLETLSPLLKAIFVMLPVVLDLTSIFLLWVVWPCSSIDWSIWLKLNSFISTLLPLSSIITFSTDSVFISVLEVVSSWAITFVNWPEPIHPTTTKSMKDDQNYSISTSRRNIQRNVDEKAKAQKKSVPYGESKHQQRKMAG